MNVNANAKSPLLRVMVSLSGTAETRAGKEPVTTDAELKMRVNLLCETLEEEERLQ